MVPTSKKVGGNNRARTCDPLLVRQMLSQLSYAPEARLFDGLLIIAEQFRFVKGFFIFFFVFCFCMKKRGKTPFFRHKFKSRLAFSANIISFSRSEIASYITPPTFMPGEQTG